MINLRGYQEAFVDKIEAAWETCRAVLGVMPTGGGKCLGGGTPVLLHSGMVAPVQDIAVGDLLMGPDGTPRLVKSVCRGREDLYRVVPTKGDPYVVNASHILSLRISGAGATVSADGARHLPGSIANVNVLDYLASSKTFKHVAKGWRAGPVKFSKKRQPIPPYILGVWLGDGASEKPSICNVDPEVVQEWDAYAHSIGHLVTKGGTDRSPEYRIRRPVGLTGGRGHKDNVLLDALRGLGVLGNKHVPDRYRLSNTQDRLELLAGVIDTDGYLRHGGYDLVFKQEALAYGVAFVARSLGLAAYVSPCRKTCTNTGATGDYFRISISGDTSVIPCRVPRRKAAPRGQKKDVLRHGIRLEPLGPGEYFGFELEGPDRLFCLGDFTVTHNTACFSVLLHRHVGASAAIVHRKEIVGQISEALAKMEVKHRVVAPPKTVARIRRNHLKKFGKSYVSPHALAGVVSVQTLTSPSSAKNRELQRWVGQVTLAVFDEGHHYVSKGFWSKAVEMMRAARLLFVTATPERADGKGLGAHADGFADTMVEGPTVQWLIDNGYLCGFYGNYFAPPTDFDVTGVPLTASGDLNTKAMRGRVVESHLVGDIVDQYLKFCPGKRAIVFATDVETATEMAKAYREVGVSAESLSGETDSGYRDATLDKFEAGEIKVLVNVDLFDEGFDVPAVDAVIMARPTESLAKYLQMVGRGLRPVYADGFDLSTPRGRLDAIAAGPKPHAVIIDPVSNWCRHGRPNWPRKWALDGAERGSRSGSDGLTPQRVCLGCSQPYEKFYLVCPYCGTPPPPPAERSGPEKVAGDLSALDDDVMDALFEAIRRADMPDEEYAVDQIQRGIPKIGRPKDMRRHQEGKYRRQVLRELVGWWVGCQGDRPMAEVHQRFFYRFGIDIATAFTLKARETDALIDLIGKRFKEDISV